MIKLYNKINLYKVCLKGLRPQIVKERVVNTVITKSELTETLKVRSQSPTEPNLLGPHRVNNIIYYFSFSYY